MAEKAFRFDHEPLRAPVELPNGFWRYDGYIARAGIYEYINTPEDEKNGYGKAGTVRRELRPEEEVSRPDVLAAYQGMSLVANHPKQEITIDNARSFEVGTVVEQPRWDAAAKRVAASFVVKDRPTLGKIKKGELNELSPGYKAMIYKTPGVDKRYATPKNPEGKYDVVQRDIEPNHLALVKFARGGGDLRVRMDGFKDVALEHRMDGLAKLTSVEQGHQHLIDTSGLSNFGCAGDGQSGSTSWAVSEGAEDGHSHAWVKANDGTITIAMAAGHTHTILDENRYAAQQAPRADDAQIDRSGASGESDVMADKPATGTMTTDEQIRLLKQQADEATAQANELKTKLAATESRADSAEALVTARDAKLTELQAQIAAGTQAVENEAVKEQATRADAAEEELRKLTETREAEIQRSATIRTKAVILMGTEFRCDGQDDREIQAAVIKKYAPDEDVSEAKSNAYIATRFDSLYEDRAKTARSHAAIAAVIKTPVETREVRADGGDGKPKLSHRDKWKEGLPQ